MMEFNIGFDLGVFPICVCTREQHIYKCNRCHQLREGRLREKCRLHPKTIFLMDISHCYYCRAPIEHLIEADSDRIVLNSENAALPNADEGL